MFKYPLPIKSYILLIFHKVYINNFHILFNIYFMKYLNKFNELNTDNILISNERVDEIIKELELITSDIDKNLIKSNNYTKELSNFTSNSKKSNTQIDDAYVNFQTLSNKLKDSIDLINNINNNLNNYNNQGEKFLA